MDKIKNYAIAILAGLLVLSLFTQPAQSAPAKTYDAVKVAEYSACLIDIALLGAGSLDIDDALIECKKMRPK